MNAEQQVKYLELELAKARAEAAQLRKKIGENSRHTRRINRAYEDALLIAMWKVAGIAVGRDYAKEQGISQNRWQNAIALLKMARVVIRERHWAVKDLPMIEQRLEAAKQRALADRNVFLLRHIRH
jgi:hypothetical protein